MKYYVYAGYYENFISGHELPKPYILRDEFETFEDAYDYLMDEWPDEGVFFTQDVVDANSDFYLFNDEDWEKWVLKEDDFDEALASSRGPVKSWYVGEPENLIRNKDYRFLNPEDFDGYEYVQAGNDFYKDLVMSADWELVKVNANGYNTFVCVDTDKKLVRNPTEREYFLLKAEPVTEDVYQQMKRDHEKQSRSFLGVVPPAVIKDYLKGYKQVKSSRRPLKSERDKTFWNMSNGYLTGDEVIKIINEIDDWCAHRALTHSDIRGYSDNDITPGVASDSIREIITCLEDLSYRLDEYNMADDEDIQNGDFDDLLPMIDDAENLCKKLLTEETYSRMYNDIFKDLELVGNRNFELNSSREIASRKISSVRVNELTEQEKDDLYEIEKNEAEEHYNSLDDSDKQMLKARYGIKNVKDYVEFFIVHPNKLSDDYEFMNDPRIKLNSRRPVKSGLDKETVSVDVNSLYHFLTDSETAEVEGDFALVRCDEDDGETYYDILSDGDLACLDGETCEIVGRGEGFVELHSVEADDGVNFKLSPEEFEVACGKSKKEIKSSLTSDSFEMMVKDSRKMAEDMNSNLDDWWVTKQVGQDVVYFVAEHKDYSVRVRFEFMDSGFCYVSKTYTNGSYYEPVALESWKYEGLSSQEIEGKMTAVLNDFFPKYNEIGSSKKPVQSSVDYEPLTKLLDDLSAYPESRMPPAGIYKRLLDWKVGSEGMDETEARKKFGTFTVGEWIDDLKESMM